MELSPGVFGPPDEDSYSIDFIIDTLNQAYPRCTGVYLSDAGHILAFYGKRGVPNAGLTLEQGMEACMIIQEIPQWMGSLAQVKVRAVSLQEATEILVGLKCLEKETLKRLQAQLSAMQLGSTLSVTAKPFTPLATSSGTVMAPSVAPQPLAIGDQPTRALYTSDDDGTTTDASVVPKKKSIHKRGRRGGRWGRRSLSGSQTDSSSASLDAASQRWVGKLADYNFSLEYQKGKDNTVADFLSQIEDRLSPSEVEECLATIPQPGVKAILNNAVEPIESRVEAGTQPLQTTLAEALEACPARLSTVHVTDWKKAQKEDPVLYQVVKNLKASREQFKEALKLLIEKKSVRDYIKMKDRLVLKDGLLYLKTYEGKVKEVLYRFLVPKAHRSKALDGCHREAAHQGQKRSLSLLSERCKVPCGVTVVALGVP